MGDSSSILLERELLRARQWLASSHREKQNERERLFQCVKAHIGFIDHQCSMQREAWASEDEDDVALDFLGDLNAADMSALLQAELEKAAVSVSREEVAMPIDRFVPSNEDVMKPLAMPFNLVSPNLKPKVKSVPISQLGPKEMGTTTTRTSSAVLGSDLAVRSLMHDLYVNVATLQYPDGEECKTEESTPPHLIKTFEANCKATDSGMIVDPDSKAKQRKYMRNVSSKSPQDPHTKKATTRENGLTELDENATEMLSWVSGYRDPDVIRRKENMRPRRTQTYRHGVTSEEQLQVQVQVKEITRASDSESEDDVSSDYLPAEDEEEGFTLEDAELVDLVNDDNVDSDEDKRLVQRNRKRLRQVKTTTRKKKRRLRTVTQKNSASKTLVPLAKEPKSHLSRSGERVNSNTSVTIKNASIEAGNISLGESTIPIKAYSSEDEFKTSGSSRIRNNEGGQLSGSQRSASDTLEAEARLKSTVGIPEHDDQSLDIANQKENVPTMAALATISTADNIFSQTADTGRKKAGRRLATEIHAVTQSASASDAEADIYDTETAQVEGQDLSIGPEDSIVVKNCTALDVVVFVGAEEVKDEPQKIIAKSPGEIQPCPLAIDDDDSETETVILDDDEPITDDQGNDYCDTSESGTTSSSDKNNTARPQSNASCSKKDGKAVEAKSSSLKDCDSNAKDKVSIVNSSGGEVDASSAGVRQFFDFAPIKLQPKSKLASFTAPKPLPVHTYAETHVNRESNESDQGLGNREKKSDIPYKPGIGSNGLRPGKKPIATTTFSKGKYAITRRCTKMLDIESNLKAKSGLKDHYQMVPNRVSIDTAKDLDDVPLATLAKEMTNKLDDKPQVRYLAYAGARNSDTRIAPKSRFRRSERLEDSLIATKGQLHKTGVRSAYSREPQISIYDALHVDGKEISNDIRDGNNYKRSSRFKKMQEEASRNGISVFKSRLQETDWDKVPIPKKRIEKTQITKSLLLQTTHERDGRTTRKHPKVLKKTSYYGPQGAQSAKGDLISRERQSWKHSTSDDRRRNESSSVHFKDRDRPRDRRDDRKRRGSARSRSRSSGRDYQSSSRYRRRSRSNSQLLERSRKRDARCSERLTSTSRDQDRTNGSVRNSLLPLDSSKKSRLTEPLGRRQCAQNGSVEETDRRAKKKQKTSHSIENAASPEALAAYDDDVDNDFISDSDNDFIAFKGETEDIRFDLDSVAVDEYVVSRQVYVTGVNPTVSAEQIEEDFARFGVAVSAHYSADIYRIEGLTCVAGIDFKSKVDSETGFPAIDIFPCQRNHLGRGDACVTFNTEKGAHEAVEELNAKNIKNSMIRVRRMDAHTQRILTVQFLQVRDTWRCTGTQCRADVSIWNAKCDKCRRKRVYGPSNTKIGAESWLCSLCFTANDPLSTICHGCKESLPEVDRSSFYTS